MVLRKYTPILWSDAVLFHVTLEAVAAVCDYGAKADRMQDGKSSGPQRHGRVLDILDLFCFLNYLYV